ncbi:MAG: TetR/AcrR family transcriptional regulator [Myxococcales bacterium]|nr:TetR/AcrR family transcriptional regulator [Myxococcales bacterium]MCB9642347.1 TetR/AcrR family transcriptional regulator [Myxococcales bacterium]
MSGRANKKEDAKRQPTDEKNITKQERILRAAIGVLAERGFHRTTIHDIAQSAGVADGTIYLYFKNKDQLLIELFEEVMARALRLFREALREEQGAEAKMRTFLHTHLRLVEHDPEIAQIISVELRQSSIFIKEYKNPLFGEYLKIIGQILHEGIEEGVFRSNLRPALITRAIFGAMDEISLAWLLSRRRDLSLEESADALAEMLLQGLRSAPSSTAPHTAS